MEKYERTVGNLDNKTSKVVGLLMYFVHSYKWNETNVNYILWLVCFLKTSLIVYPCINYIYYKFYKISISC